jgi:phage protein D
MIAQVRAAKPAIILNGTDYYSALAPYLLSLEYTDNCDGEKADDLQIELADRDKRFISDWMPDKGTFLDVSIIAERWFALNAPALVLDCGRFWIDAVDFEMPANTVTIKACSIPTTAHLKVTDETRGWEHQTLREIAQQIADESDMDLLYPDDITNPRFSRIEQTEENALAFLKNVANECKLAIKIHRGTIVFFDEEIAEAKEPSFNIIYGDGIAALASAGLPTYRMSGGHFVTKLTDVAKKVKLKYNKMGTGKVSDEEFTDPNQDFLDDQISLRLNENLDFEEPEAGEPPELREELVSDWNADASAGGQLKAKAALRETNKDKNNAQVNLAIGNPVIAAGMTCNVSGVGQYDGKYFVVSARHTVEPMYTTALEIRKCLTGY